VGPDYIDPGYHALATGRPGRNLDAYMCGPDLVAPLFLHGAQGCDLAVVEGVMGLFDGASGHGELGSTAQVAKLLRAPVVLVADASSQARSVAALVHGFATWDPGVRLAGVVLNKVGSDRHESVLREALAETGVPVLGVLRRTASLAVPSRHLGLVPAAERRPEAVAWLRELAATVRESCDLDALMAVARTAPPLDAEPWRPLEPARPRGDGPVVAVAGGAAFTFGYAENLELLRAAGARCVPFDPLADEVLPPDTAGIVIGGGFPEAYAPELSANEPLRRLVRDFRGPVAAECAGLLYLTRALDGSPMCGVLDATAAMTDRLTLGYREAVALSDSVLAAPGTRVRGHEFHRTRVTAPGGAGPAWGFTGPRPRTEGAVHGNVHASYLHVHWAAAPSMAARFVERCAA
jgi:cobyrinic acid a,c-diamide synthase